MRVHTMQELHRGDRVKITFDNGKSVTGEFVTLVNEHERKGGRFAIDGFRRELLILSSTELGTHTVERA